MKVDREVLKRECGERDWDGYDGEPVTDGAITLAEGFVAGMPDWMPEPDDVSVDPDGDVSLDWDGVLSLAFSADTVCVCAGGTGPGLRILGSLRVKS